MSEPVTLRLVHSWRWECPNCKTANMESGVAADLTDEDRRELSALMGEGQGEWQPFPEMVRMPENVTCEHCEMTFTATEESAP